jgi:heme exporter protein B|tara:strand:- start:1375 stop:2076 length:702 start_codon:yes stop_codon:yes gene_type:complete
MNSNSENITKDIKTLFSLFKKDLKLEFRSLSTILITIVFTALIVVLFNIAFPFGVAQKNEIISIIIWVVFLFSSLIVSSGMIELDTKDNSLELILMYGIKSEIYFLSKVLSVFTILSVVQLTIFSLFYVLFQLNFQNPVIILVAILTNIGISSITVILGILSVRNNLNQNILSILVIPFTLPYLLGAVEVTNQLTESGNINYILNSLYAIVSFDLIFLISGAILIGVYFKLEK